MQNLNIDLFNPNVGLSTPCIECPIPGYNEYDKRCQRPICMAKKKQPSVAGYHLFQIAEFIAPMPVIIRKENNFRVAKVNSGKRFKESEILDIAIDKGYSDEVSMWTDLATRMLKSEIIKYTGLPRSVVNRRYRQLNIAITKKKGYDDNMWQSFAKKAGFKSEADMFFDDGKKVWKAIMKKTGVSAYTFVIRKRQFKEK